MRFFFALAILPLACGGRVEAPREEIPDASPEAGLDAVVDAAPDAAPEAAVECMPLYPAVPVLAPAADASVCRGCALDPSCGPGSSGYVCWNKALIGLISIDPCSGTPVSCADPSDFTPPTCCTNVPPLCP
jgi:hypothetical protein